MSSYIIIVDLTVYYIDLKSLILLIVVYMLIEINPVFVQVYIKGVSEQSELTLCNYF